MRASNQDACGEFRDRSGARAFVLCDGMGGRRGGEIASRLAIEAIGRVFASSQGPIKARLEEAFVEANREIVERSEADPRLVGMGTTAVVLVLDGSARGFVAHVGDSRAYHLRHGTLRRLTADHSVVGELERHGAVTREQAATHPRRNELLRSVGNPIGVDVEIAPVDVELGDRFLLCSDGLWSLVPEEKIAPVLEGEVPVEAVRRLVAMANAEGGTDNVTAQVARVPPLDAPPGPELPAAQTRARESGVGLRMRRWIDAIRRWLRRR